MQRLTLLSLLALACTNNVNDDTVIDTLPGDTGTPGIGEDALIPSGEVHPGGNVIHIMDMDVTDGDAILAAYSGIIRLDVSDPSAMEFLGNPGEKKLYWTDTHKNFLMVSGRESGVRLIHRGSDGEWTPGPKYKPSGVYTEGVSMNDSHAFIALQSQGVAVVTLPNLQEQVRLSFATNAVDVLVEDDLLFISDRDVGLIIVDISDPSQPALLTTLSLPSSPQQLLLHEDRVYIAASSNLVVVNVADPTSPSVIAAIPTNGLAQRLDRHETLLAVANWHDTRVYDISDPSSPLIVAVEASQDASMSVDIEAGTVFVGDWDDVRSYQLDETLKSPEITFDQTLTVTGGPGEIQTTLVVQNDGNMGLNITDVQCEDPMIRSDKSTLLIAPGDSDIINLTTTLVDTSVAELHCTLESNDADEPSADLTLNINPEGLGIGDPAPVFSLPDLDGTLFTLSDNLGQAVMISIFSSL